MLPNESLSTERKKLRQLKSTLPCRFLHPFRYQVRHFPAIPKNNHSWANLAPATIPVVRWRSPKRIGNECNDFYW